MKKKKISKEVILKTFDMVLVMSLVASFFSTIYFIKNLKTVGVQFLVFGLLALILLLVTLFLVKKENKYTSIVGVLAGIFLIFTRTILGIVFGILLIYNSIRLEKYIK